MKNPEEIKHGLEIVVNGCLTCGCCATNCPYDPECHPMNEDTNVDMPKQMAADAIAYIQQLENHIGKLTEKVAQLEAAQPRWINVKDGYQGATQSENSLNSCTVYGGGELNFDVPPGRYPIVCQSTHETEKGHVAGQWISVEDE